MCWPVLESVGVYDFRYLFKRRNVRPIILDILESSQKGGPQRESQREQLEAAQQEEQPEEEMEKQKKAGKVLNVAGRRGFKCLLLNPSIGPGKKGTCKRVEKKKLMVMFCLSLYQRQPLWLHALIWNCHLVY